MNDEFKFNENGSDATYLAHANIFFPALFSTPIFQHDWREDKLGSQSVLQNCLDFLRQKFEGGLTGNRHDIAARKEARKDLNQRIRRILQYVGIFGHESDFEMLLSTGVITRKSGKRVRKASKSVSTN